ncbi:MAG TPA: phage holin family protein [Candidatus Fusicatenibacter merdavium]|mgnify:CR=1 FL=1|uniref:Phage holin family protein n=1 Tax=Candidatus Fusicatenibacter merdavium TaxID=2838600 RepID=A0A9D1XDI2_9FIRM|nr:phage holin family protein [Candidatus Fusicatenibacter merdavium]
MEELMSYIRPELLVVSVVLYLIGIGLKKAGGIKDRYIPLILGGAGILLCGIWVLATSELTDPRCVAMAVFTSVVQGILVAGLSTYVNQMAKQMKKEE